MKKMLAATLQEIAEGIEKGQYAKKSKIALTTIGSELGTAELVKGAEMASQRYPEIEILLIGPVVETDLEVLECDCLAAAHQLMEEKLESGEVAGAVTLHYNFPLGVATVGKVVTPAVGKEMIISTTTGASDTDRVSSMVKNTLYGIATAHSLGINNPTVGILNIEGANLVERNLKKLCAGGYRINFANSAREDGGVTMRGNDLLQGTPDIMVCDSLTGNLLMKVFSSFTTGGGYESSGSGYGPGVGSNQDRVINIISRASGAPVVANAIKFAAEASKNRVNELYREELARAEKAGLKGILASLKEKNNLNSKEVTAPPAKSVGEEIPGIDILEIDEAQKALWQQGIYAETGMGCTGPVILVAEEEMEQAIEILSKNGYR